MQSYECMKKIELEEKQERKERFTFLTSLAIGVTILLALLQLVLSNHLASYGKELANLGKTDKALSFENELLKKEIASQSAIATISQKAKSLSLGPASKFLVVEEVESVALLHTNRLQ